MEKGVKMKNKLVKAMITACATILLTACGAEEKIESSSEVEAFVESLETSIEPEESSSAEESLAVETKVFGEDGVSNELFGVRLVAIEELEEE